MGFSWRFECDNINAAQKPDYNQNDFFETFVFEERLLR